jgi:hypothetical protein
MKKVITKADIFGHKISLNFNKKGSTHRSFAGGAYSIFLVCFILYYVSSRFSILVTRDDNKLFTLQRARDATDLTVPNDRLIWSNAIQHWTGPNQVETISFDDEKFKKYISINYYHRDVVWANRETNPYIYTPIGIKHQE